MIQSEIDRWLGFLDFWTRLWMDFHKWGSRWTFHFSESIEYYLSVVSWMDLPRQVGHSGSTLLIESTTLPGSVVILGSEVLLGLRFVEKKEERNPHQLQTKERELKGSLVMTFDKIPSTFKSNFVREAEEQKSRME